MAGFSFYAIGTPGPQGSKRHVGRGIMVESSAKVKPWRQSVMAAAPAIAAPLDGPLVARMVFTLARPKSARKIDVAPCKPPDLDKLVRSTADAITEAGLWADDARIVEFNRLAKVWWGFDDEALPIPGVLVAVVERGTRHHRAAELFSELWDLSAAAQREALLRVRGQVPA